MSRLRFERYTKREAHMRRSGVADAAVAFSNDLNAGVKRDDPRSLHEIASDAYDVAVELVGGVTPAIAVSESRCTMIDTTTPESREGSLKYEPTEEQAQYSPMLAACARSGMTETQTIEMLWREYKRLSQAYCEALTHRQPPIFIAGGGR